jgi:hypothetical protein
MLEEAEDAVRARPVVVAMTVIAVEDFGSRGADLFQRLEPAGGDAPASSPSTACSHGSMPINPNC